MEPSAENFLRLGYLAGRGSPGGQFRLAALYAQGETGGAAGSGSHNAGEREPRKRATCSMAGGHSGKRARTSSADSLEDATSSARPSIEILNLPASFLIACGGSPGDSGPHHPVELPRGWPLGG
jgi:hypothetical protein